MQRVRDAIYETLESFDTSLWSEIFFWCAMGFSSVSVTLMLLVVLWKMN
jgi:hypothetical protein